MVHTASIFCSENDYLEDEDWGGEGEGDQPDDHVDDAHLPVSHLQCQILLLW